MVVTFGKTTFEYDHIELHGSVKVKGADGVETIVQALDLLKFATFIAVKLPNSSVDPRKRN